MVGFKKTLTFSMKVSLSMLLLLFLQIQWISALDEPSFGCGFNDNDLIVNVTSRSPHSTGQWFTWKDGKINYYFKGNVKEGDKELTRDIMREIESHTCFKYIEHNTEPAGHHLEIVVGTPTCYRNGFSAYVQPQQPYPYKKVLLRSIKQLTNHESCDNRGGFMHEMMHALGVGHTQKRADRDKYIILNDDNIEKMSQYSVCDGCRLYKDVPYDCSSIMHYGQGTFSVGRGRPTMRARYPETCKLSWNGPAFDVGEPAQSDWKLLKIIAGQVCDIKKSKWLPWSEWSACSQSCGDGRKSRTRTCTVAGKCEGESQQEVKCSLQDIHENPEECPGWKSHCAGGEWKDWMQKNCARTCNCGGGGTAKWLPWSEWSACSEPCGDGRKSRTRTCEVSGKCKGESQQEAKCSLQNIHENPEECPGWKSHCAGGEWKDWMEKNCARTCNCGGGGTATWSSWSEWSGCSASCGDGTKTRKRTCSISGKCPGDSQQTNKCDLPNCDSCFESDIHRVGFGLYKPGGNNNYGATGSAKGCQLVCQKTAGCAWFNWIRKQDECWLKTEKGNKIKQMPGDVTGPRTCQTGTATWSSWSEWIGCSASCGDGTKTRTRTCSISGKCPGDSQQTNKCDLPNCATWSSWSEWSGCSASCGDGTKTRTRTCSVSGKCSGDSQQSNKCVLPKCASCFEFDIHHVGYGLNKPGGDNNFGATGSAKGCQSVCQKTTGCAWFNWVRQQDECWLKTEKGTKIKQMPGDVSGPRTCQTGTGKGTWSSWSEWSGCSAVCGDGTKTRERTCSVSGECPGDSQQTNKCDLPDCGSDDLDQLCNRDNDVGKRNFQIMDKINQYRSQIGRSQLKCSGALVSTAKHHTRNQMDVNPSGRGCNLHSWLSTKHLGKGGKKCCYKSNHSRPNCMWKKPEEILGWDGGNGFEISYMGGGGAGPDEAFKGWRRSSGHDNVMASNGAWKSLTKVGCYYEGNYANCWFAM